MRALLAADRVRFGRRRDLWLLLALVPVILAVMFVADFNSTTAVPQIDFFFDPPDPVAEAELRAQQLAEWRAGVATQLPTYAFPASLLKVAGNVLPVILLAVYLATALVAGEFEWGTVRTVHLTSSRVAAMAVRVGVLIGLVGLVVAVGLLFASILPFLLTFEGKPVQDYAAPVPDLVSTLLSRLAAVLPFVAVPVLLAVVARSIGLAFLLTVLLLVADVAITGAPIWTGSPASWVPALTITGSVGRMLGGDGMPQAAVVPVGVSLGALVAWVVLPIAGAIALFRRIDLNE